MNSRIAKHFKSILFIRIITNRFHDKRITGKGLVFLILCRSIKQCIAGAQFLALYGLGIN